MLAEKIHPDAIARQGLAVMPPVTISCIRHRWRLFAGQRHRNKLAIIGGDIVGSGKKGVIHVHRKVDHDALIGSILALAPDAIQNLTRLGMR